MQLELPRLLIGGTQSGCGKTTVTSAILQAFVDRGQTPAAFKCGPDYIDPMFHTEVIGAPCSAMWSRTWSTPESRLSRFM